MPIFLYAVIAIIVIIVAAILLAKGTAVFDSTVQKNRLEIEKAAAAGSGYNMALTMGYKIPVDADYETQIREARLLAAKKAAAAVQPKNVDDLTPEQRAKIEQVEARRAAQSSRAE